LKNNFISIIRNYPVIISIIVVLISFKSSNQWSTFPIGNELFWWILQSVFVYILFKIKNLFSNQVPDKNLNYVNIYLLWNLICIIRGVFIAENYWEWKSLISHGFFLQLPLIIYLANSYFAINQIVKTWIRYGLILFIFWLPFLYEDGVGQYLIPISFTILFFPILRFRWKFVIVSLSIFAITFDLSARGNIFKYLAPLCFGCLFYIQYFHRVKVLNMLRFILLYSPLVLLFLGVLGVFNPFKLDDYFGNYSITKRTISGEKVEETLTADTRTFLYLEVLESAVKHNYALWGRTPARGNDSAYFGDFSKEILKTGKQERYSNEVSILNIFTWLGLIGGVLYFLVFLKASYLAINESNNIFIKLVGLNVSFRWTYGFVEDFSNFDLSNIFLWLMLGMCFSKSFRQMSNYQMKNWVLSIFESQNYPKSLSRPNRPLN
jgi:hypothetical protein